ncbi:MAG: alpha-amylase family glycosyl hydrolase [Muribaculaceae bacterium]|nr:alpha-amylase family glycosyl hydrolase [Muribaculaceae bacterium]
MKKLTIKAITLLALLFGCLATPSASAQNYAWPASWEGVMLQGFYWDSYSDTKWTNLTAQADELSQYFRLIWVPNSGKAGSGQQMGYMPQYWFTNHNSSFGTEAQLRTMIATYKAKGTGIIADVVINHRNGVTSWADFPTEEWNGRTWHIGLDGICRNDNMAGSGHGTPTGAYDTGESFDGCRDLDHTNANVQDNCKNYCKFLLDDLGYAGFRLDMVKGYAGRFTKIYNEYSKPTYCVGEYWDGSYDAVKAWIDATGKQSAAFDFPFKYAVNEAFSSGDMTKLVWMAGYTTPQPAGMIHYGYQQYAVTFLDNHDTYRDDWNKFNGNVVAANAFMLCSPGAPCVFLPHYKQYKTEIQRLINIRNSVGVSNTSAVNVLKSESSCHMAEVTGSKGKLVVKIGPAMVSPSGYSDSDIVASGNDYCIWTKTKIEGGNGNNGDDTPVVGGNAPDKLYLMGNIPQGAWKTNAGIAMTKDGDKYIAKCVTIEDAGEGKNLGFFSFVTALGSTGDSSEWDAVINSSDRYGAISKDAPVSVGGSAELKAFYAGADASSAYSWAIEPGTYDITADFADMKISVTKPETGIENIDLSMPDVEPVYYTPQGIRVESPVSGLYIVVRGTKVTKEYIR